MSERVSIHAPREGRDSTAAPGRRADTSFNPRAPWRGATNLATRFHAYFPVSIHAPP